MEKKILFVSHYAGRTGAPIVLLNHLAGLKVVKSDLEFDVMLRKDGELKSNFQNIADTFLFSKPNIVNRVKNKLLRQPAEYSFLKQKLKRNYKIIYGNTIDTLEVLLFAKKINPYIITVLHLHELELILKEYYGEKKFSEAIPNINYLVATSATVKDYLVNTFEINPEKIFVHHGHIPLPPNKKKESSKIGLKVYGSGPMDWRKGIDLFIQTAYHLNQLNPNADFEFTWIGGNGTSLDYEKVAFDIKKLDIGHRIKLIFNCPNPWDYLVDADLFLLTSREDPFPLVCLEAAAMGIPIMCFNNAGGMVEFVNEANGWIINYLDIPQVTTTLTAILNDPNFKTVVKAKGDLSQQKAKDFSIEKGVLKWAAYLDKICAENNV